MFCNILSLNEYEPNQNQKKKEVFIISSFMIKMIFSESKSKKKVVFIISSIIIKMIFSESKSKKKVVSYIYVTKEP